MKIIFFYARVRIILHCAGYAYCATTDILGAFSRINASILPYHTSYRRGHVRNLCAYFPYQSEHSVYISVLLSSRDFRAQ